MPKGRRINGDFFNDVKLALSTGATQYDVASLYGISKATVSYIANAETYDSYIEYESAHNRRRTTAKARGERTTDKSAPQIEPAKPAQTVVQSVVVPYHVTQELQKTNALLTQISAKLAYIVEQLS